MHNDISKNNNSFVNAFFLYSLIFGITAVGVYFYYAIYHETLLWIGDGVHQLYPKLVNTKHLFVELLNGNFHFWSWDSGIGIDTLGFYKASLLDPTIWIACLFPVKLLDLGYSISVVLKLFLAGLTFLLFLRMKGSSLLQQMAGSISYAFCAWIVVVSLTQGHLLISAVLFPLIIMGIDKIIDGKSPILFIVTVMLQVLYSTYFAYMVAIMVILYYFVKWFFSKKGAGFVVFIKDFFYFILCGLSGILISAVLSISSIYTLSNISTESGAAGKTTFLFTLKQYLNLSDSFITGDIYESFSILALPSLFLLLMPFALYNIKNKSVLSCMAIICLFFALFPVISSLFNGGSYVTGRWFFMLYFFLIASIIECLEINYKANKKLLIPGIMWLFLLAMIFDYSNSKGLNNNNELLYGIITLVCSFLALLVMLTGPSKRKSIMIVMILIINIVLCNNIIYLYKYSDSFLPYRFHSHVGNAYNRFERSPLRSASRIKDNNFYRIELLTGVVDSPYTKIPYNENLFFHDKALPTYFSSLDGNWIAFNTVMGNSAGLVRRVYVASNDNRPALDTIMGVKYYFGKNEKQSTNASIYAPYGFDYYKTVSGTEVYKNKYNIGIGAFFKTCITQKEFEKLNYAQKEKSLLQNIVITDKYYNKQYDYQNTVNAKSSTEGVRELTYKIDGLKGASFKNGVINVTSKDNQIELQTTGDYHNCIMMICFEKLIRNGDNATDGQFELMVSNGSFSKRIMNNMGHPQGFPLVEDYNLCFNYHENWDGKYRLSFSRPGKYSFDSIKVMGILKEKYDSEAKKLTDNRIKNVVFNNDIVKGSVNAPDNGYVFLSVPPNIGWEIKIDGKEVEKLNNTNYCFTAVRVKKGIHSIELVYNYVGFKYGIIVSFAGLMLLSLLILFRRKRYFLFNKSE